MTRSLTAAEFGALLRELAQPTALIEAAVLLGCLAAAWLLVRLLRGARAVPGSIWFGNGVIDGVLFPVLALLCALAARWALTGVVPLAVFRLVVPVLVSLVVIRLLARVLQRAFPNSTFVRAVQTTVSWIAWIAVALWVTGVLPLALEELDAISWRIGSTRLSVRNVIEGALTATVVLMIALWVSATLEARLLKGATHDLSVRKMAANVLRAVLLFVGLMFALSAAGIDLTALGVLGGALGVGIGFGLQKLAANYISGFVILAERSMRIGDMVKVDNFEGRIRDITTRYRGGTGFLSTAIREHSATPTRVTSPRKQDDHEQKSKTESLFTFKAKVAVDAIRGERTLAGLAKLHDVHANQIVDGKNQLLTRAAGVSGADATVAPAVDLKELHAKIGRLALENDFLAGALDKVGLSSAKR